MKFLVLRTPLAVGMSFLSMDLGVMPGVLGTRKNGEMIIIFGLLGWGKIYQIWEFGLWLIR
ncbi:hypothetical protein BJP37_25215 [Moorena bouillonii PNG]|uniref:Uncharacterized protein n=1 Tax=Moorena bouillonii PNG TaxID=568701 RepID=A0A1U7N7B7_9CYAN|nr:hypothetical protein BJP37_25215 [Moorena bouillonii PNG]